MYAGGGKPTGCSDDRLVLVQVFPISASPSPTLDDFGRRILWITWSNAVLVVYILVQYILVIESNNRYVRALQYSRIENDFFPGDGANWPNLVRCVLQLDDFDFDCGRLDRMMLLGCRTNLCKSQWNRGAPSLIGMI